MSSSTRARSTSLSASVSASSAQHKHLTWGSGASATTGQTSLPSSRASSVPPQPNARSNSVSYGRASLSASVAPSVGGLRSSSNAPSAQQRPVHAALRDPSPFVTLPQSRERASSVVAPARQQSGARSQSLPPNNVFRTMPNAYPDVSWFQPWSTPLASSAGPFNIFGKNVSGKPAGQAIFTDSMANDWVSRNVDRMFLEAVSKAGLRRRPKVKVVCNPTSTDNAIKLQVRAMALADQLDAAVVQVYKAGSQSQLFEGVERAKERAVPNAAGLAQHALTWKFHWYLEGAQNKRLTYLRKQDAEHWHRKAKQVIANAQTLDQLGKSQNQLEEEIDSLCRRYPKIVLPDVYGLFGSCWGDPKWSKPTLKKWQEDWLPYLESSTGDLRWRCHEASKALAELQQSFPKQRLQSPGREWLKSTEVELAKRYQAPKASLRGIRSQSVGHAKDFPGWQQEGAARRSSSIAGGKPNASPGVVWRAANLQDVRNVVGENSVNLPTMWGPLTDPKQYKKWVTASAEQWEPSQWDEDAFASWTAPTYDAKGAAPLHYYGDDGRGRGMARRSDN